MGVRNAPPDDPGPGSEKHGPSPDHRYASHEAQVYGQIGLLAQCWNRRTFSLKDEAGVPVFSGLTFPQAAKRVWKMMLPGDPAQVDLEAWTLALSMTEARAFGPYPPNALMLDACLKGASELWKLRESGRQGTLDLDSLSVPSGFHPFCSCCETKADCPKFAGPSHAELKPDLDELALWKAQRSALDAQIKEREAAMKEWYARAGVEGQWIEAGSRRFRVTQQPGRRTLVRGRLTEERHVIFPHDTVDALLARCEYEGEPSLRLALSPAT